MTLESRINKSRYVGNGATKIFPFAFKVWEKDQVVVFAGDGTLESDVSSICSITLTATGGSVEFPTAPPSGTVVVVRRKMPYIQEDDYRNGTRFDSEEVEDRFDQDCAERQDLRLDVDRAIKVPETSTQSPEDLWMQIQNWYNEIMRALDQSVFHIVMSNEVASRHDGVTSSGIGSYPNYFLALPQAEVKAHTFDYYDSAAGRDGSRLNDVLAIGYDALQGPLATPNKRISDTIAIGGGTLARGTYIGPHNIAIGLWALRNVQSTKANDTVSGFDGDRNIAIGSICFTEVTTGRCNVGLGRDVGQGITTGSYNTAIGYGALAGYAPVDLAGNIANNGSLEGNANTAVGRSSGSSLVGSASDNVFVGTWAGGSVKAGNGNIYLGSHSGRYIDYYTSTNGKKLVHVSGDADFEYSQTGSSLTVNMPNSGAVVGGYVVVRFLTGEIHDVMPLAHDQQWLTVTAVDSEKFVLLNDATYQGHTYDGMSGTLRVLEIELADEQAPVGANGGVIIGYCAGQYISSCETSNIIGAWALRGTTVDDIANSDKPASANTSNVVGSLAAVHSSVLSSEIIGYRAAGYQNNYTNDGENGEVEYSVLVGMFSALNTTNVLKSVGIGYGNTRNSHNYVRDSVIIGCNACSSTEDLVDRTVAIGCEACNQVSTYEDVFIGRKAGSGENIEDTLHCVGIGCNCFTSDSLSGDITNSIAIGYNSNVSGSNQCQLGNSSVTVYAYGSVQDRSDERDKTDIRDSVLGLDFIKSLRAVDFRWDYRDDYVDHVEHEEEYLDIDGNTARRTVLETVKREKDGSRKRTRFHHGFIAQEVKAVLDEQGIDFGGYQDHKINGGADVLTLGYEEFIAPIVKAIQQIDKRLSALEA